MGMISSCVHGSATYDSSAWREGMESVEVLLFLRSGHYSVASGFRTMGKTVRINGPPLRCLMRNYLGGASAPPFFLPAGGRGPFS